MVDDVKALLRRVEQLEAVNAIVRLSADYCHGADRRDLELFMSVWTEDAEWQVRDDLTFVGVNQIEEAISRQWKSSLRGFHRTSNPRITVSSNGFSAAARFDVHSEVELPDSSWLAITGSYTDRYAKIAEQWKLARRVAEVWAQRPL